MDPTRLEAEEVLTTVEEELLNEYGLKTLAQGEENYVEIYEGSPEKRDTSYHQGITWPWLLGLYYNSLKNMIKFTKNTEKRKQWEVKLDKFVDKTTKTFQKEIFDHGCIGGIAELYDSAKPQLPKGAINQAWSVAEVFRIILRR